MSRPPIKEESTVKLGGVIVAKYHAYEDYVEQILIVLAKKKFFAVVAHGRQAQRSFRVPVGTTVSVSGTILEYPLPKECGYRVVYAVYCQRMKFGNALEQVPPDPLEEYMQLPKHQIFVKCDSLNRGSH
ncbi:hypothetical protein [Desulfofustis glycolicus]|uniref:Uncharacterized protein n=1 Tax=Desulfofustis glycolicus DSM 9705 TaxID=1121409 RepID=A0A1M5UJB9_9BACT|nr:hypothetical protein [Desulfofustis glycolicus]SHH63172.1 hypothetical protein SAMN02745124_01203 [Desulfofustis glycolicus DSM 9705]